MSENPNENNQSNRDTEPNIIEHSYRPKKPETKPQPKNTNSSQQSSSQESKQNKEQ